MSSHSCFIIMPFKNEFRPVRDTIYEAVKESARGQAIRADDIFRQGEVIDHVKEAIERADFCVADTTDNNPNVMWEVGYARALRKPVVVIRQNTEQIPFDVRAERVFIYKLTNLASLRKQLVGVIERLNEELEDDPSPQSWRYDEISHLRRSLERCTPRTGGDTLLILVRSAVRRSKAKVRRWECGDERKFLNAVKPSCMNKEEHQNAFWWLVVYGILVYDQIEVFQDRNNGVIQNLPLVEFSQRGLAFLRWMRDTI
ncbi:MAG: nucleoside 2-deoxyribosyltransferase [Verrucomicrobiales bacterium]|nr:nucleoside 2-deoxyribosyltransferase [Verrucomicrobiales bacterium]